MRRVGTGATPLLVLLLVIVFARLSLATGRAAPMDILIDVLIDHGARIPDGEWWRAATSALLHDGLFPLGFSILSLLVAGPMLEDRYGRWLLVPVFFGSAVVASFFSSAVDGTTIAVGASGGAMGIVGALAGDGQRLWKEGPRRGRTQRNEMLLWSVFVVFFGFAVRADQWAHLGGFLVGAAFGYAVRPERVRETRIEVALAVAGLLVLFATTVAALVPLPPPPSDDGPTLPDVELDLAIDDSWPTGDPGDPDDLGSQVWACHAVEVGDRATLDETWPREVTDRVCAHLASIRKACAADPDGVIEECAELKRIDEWFANRAIQRQR